MIKTVLAILCIALLLVPCVIFLWHEATCADDVTLPKPHDDIWVKSLVFGGLAMQGAGYWIPWLGGLGVLALEIGFLRYYGRPLMHRWARRRRAKKGDRAT